MKQRIFLASLTGGVSRQPQTQRLLNQLQEADNATMAMARGLQKRPGTKAIAALTGVALADIEDQCIIWCQDYSGTRFFILIDKTLTQPFKAFKIDGTALTIAYTSGHQADVRAYIKSGSTDTRDSYTWAYFGNQLMIANRDVTTATSGSAQNYQYSGTAVRNQANAHHCPSVDDPTNGFPLPPAADGEYWYTQTSSVGFPAGFYITQNHTGVGPWYARVQCQEANSLLSQTTMPIVCALSGSTLTFSKVTWTPRYSGSSLTNPPPTFIGKKISNLAYHRGRLFICADDRIVASKVNEPYNFWLNDYSNVVDDDIIDIGLPAHSGKVIQLGSFSKALVIMSSQGRQFQIRADNALTPTGVYLIPSTGYPCSAICNPSIIGNHLYFAANRGNCSQVRDYFYSFDANSNIAPDISAHVEGYLPPDIGKMSVSPADDILVVASRNQLSSLYVYQSYFTISQRIQASWFRWTFQNAEVMSHEAFDGVLYILFKRDGKYYLESIELHAPLIQDASLGFAVHYDRRTSALGDYNSTTNTTSWTVPYQSDNIDEAILGTGFDSRIGRRVSVSCTVGTNQTVLTVLGRYDQGLAWIGQNFEMNATLSQQFIRDDNQGVQMGALHLLLMKVDHRNTGGYDVRVTPKNRSTKTWRFTPLAAGHTILGQIAIQDYGAFYCKTYCNAKDSTIQITSNTPLPCTINDIQFSCRFVKGKAAI